MPCLPPRIAMLILASTALSIQIAQADDITINRLLAAQCSQCHGTNGYSVAGIEPLAGESAKDLYEDLMDMRSEDRPENIMDHQALGYTEDQIRRIAAYYSTLSEPGGSEDESD
ncbi:MAG: c-type cytochrome [Gammaproteobacteria bacterium]|nr:c-type cytochrome [Gammaproteobacteria bacterium]